MSESTPKKRLVVGGLGGTKRYELDDGVQITVAEALRQYYELPTTGAVAAKLKGMTVHVNNENVDVADIERVSVGAGSFVTVYATEVSQGGVRGAY